MAKPYFVEPGEQALRHPAAPSVVHGNTFETKVISRPLTSLSRWAIIRVSWSDQLLIIERWSCQVCTRSEAQVPTPTGQRIADET